MIGQICFFFVKFLFINIKLEIHSLTTTTIRREFYFFFNTNISLFDIFFNIINNKHKIFKRIQIII